jgi:DNA-binding beta-propeller fold protein YncE
MWTDIGQRLIYQTQWFDTKLTVFNRETGRLVRNIDVGESPAHVMTRVDTDQVHVSINGEGNVVELSPGARRIDRRIDTQHPGDLPAQPHAHWMSHDGQTMVTPNSNTNDSTELALGPGAIVAKTPTGFLPIASGMMPDASKYYVSNYVDSTITCISIGAPRCRDGSINLPTKTISLLLGGTTLGNYDPIAGTGFATSGGLPIQTPVSPNGKYMVTAATLTGTITIIDTTTDTLVKVLPCSAGCHGVNFGAKKGGGYYAYVSSKFSNDLIVVDPDPNDDGNPMDARIAGRIVLAIDNSRDRRDRDDDDDSGDDDVQSDDRVSAYAGMGGQGVLAIPLVYNGWVQKLPADWKRRLTARQLDPTQSRSGARR